MTYPTTRQYAQITVASILAFILIACATLGVPDADTFNKRVLVANSMATQAAVTIGTLRQNGKLSQPDARDALEGLRSASAGIDLAIQLHETSPTAGEQKLSSVITALTVLTQYLEARK